MRRPRLSDNIRDCAFYGVAYLVILLVILGMLP